MLSEEQKQRLSDLVQAWQESGVSQIVADRVHQIALADVGSDEEVLAICDQQMWAHELLEWYDKFLEFVKEHKATQPSETDSSPREQVLQDLQIAIDALQRIKEWLQ